MRRNMSERQPRIPVRSLTAKVCVSDLWVSRELEAEHPDDD